MTRTSTRIDICVLVPLICLSLGVTLVWAQATAQISGSVKDQSGAVLPGVEVTATQTATGAKRSAVTDETGSYILQNLPIGPYTIEAALPGFKTYVQSGIVLQVGTNPTVNATLQVGQVSDQVEVQADAALVETRSSGVGNVIDNQRVLELATEWPQSNRTDLSGRRCGSDNGWLAQFRRPELCHGRHSGRRRHEWRSELHAGRRNARRSGKQFESAAAVPGCAAGVQGRNERIGRAIRPSRCGNDQRRHEVRHQCISRRRVRIPAQRRAERARTFTRPAKTASSATSSAARSADRSSGTRCSSSSENKQRSAFDADGEPIFCSHRENARRRLHRLCFIRVPEQQEPSH